MRRIPTSHLHSLSSRFERRITEPLRRWLAPSTPLVQGSSKVAGTFDDQR
jgi:hypothetical protein